MTTNPIIPTLLLTLAFSALAQSMPPGPPPDPVGMAIDKNHNQELSKREIRDATKSLLKLDEDDDGALSAEELRPEPPRHERLRNRDDEGQAPPPRPPSRLLAAIDSDGSGDLSSSEIEAAPAALAKVDKDGDGKLDSEELGIGGPGGGGPGEGGAQGGPPGGGPPGGGRPGR